MFNVRHFVAAPALVLLMGGTAQAALTADQVWKAWQDGAGVAGLDLKAATEANVDGTLTLNGVTLAPPSVESPLTISDIVFTEQSDGTVQIVPGKDISLAVKEDDKALNLKLAHDNLVIVAREGEGGGIVYDYSADALEGTGDSSWASIATEEGAEAKTATGKGTFTASGVKGSYSDVPGANRSFNFALSLAKVGYSFSSDDPGLETRSSATSEGENIELAGKFVLPSEIALGSIASAADFGTALQQGLALNVTTSQGASRGSSSEENPYLPMAVTMTAEPNSAVIEFNKDRFAVKSDAGAFKATVTSAAAPGPIDIALDSFALDLLTPVMAGDVSSDYRVKMAMNNLVIGDSVWAMFDPETVLPRDAINLNIDLSGKAKADLVALAASSEAGGAPAVPQLETLDITDVSLNLAGAAAKAVGAFTFDNSAGIPMPVGTADVTVKGSEQLINGLIKLGVLSEDDAMGARMMMAAFMKPGADADTLESKIEAKEGFQIFVNGQQIQ